MRILRGTANDAEQVQLGGVPLQWVEIVEYIGLRLCSTGFLGKDLAEAEAKGKAAMYMLLSEDWFDKDLELK